VVLTNCIAEETASTNKNGASDVQRQQQQQQQANTPWPLVRKRTIPTERPSGVQQDTTI
jgi:hypothetical protein